MEVFKAAHVNLAYKKELSLWGQILHPHEAGKAVDGERGTSTRDVQCAIITTNKGASYMQVDLGQTYRLGLIRILNTEDNPARLHDLNITVYGDIHGEERACAQYPGPAPEGWIEVQCAHVIFGRHVRVTKTAHGSRNPLIMCELEVYETQAFEFVRQHGYQCESYDIDVRSRSEMHCAMLCRETSNCLSFNTGVSENSVQCQIITKNKCRPKRNAHSDVMWSYFTTIEYTLFDL